LQAVGIKLHAAYCWDRQTGNGMAGNPETKTAMKRLLIMVAKLPGLLQRRPSPDPGERQFDRLVGKYYPGIRRDFPRFFSEHH
jgi:hypothetical protein